MSDEDEKKLLSESFENFELIEDGFRKTISHKVKELWTVEGKDPTYKPPINRTTYR